MKNMDSLAAVQEQLESLSEWSPDLLDRQRTVVLTIDMNRGFTCTGALASPRVAAIIPRTAAFLRDCRKRGIPIIGVTDCHQPDAAEFQSYPVHCLEGTEESELVSEICDLPDAVIRKNSTNAFFAPGMAEALKDAETTVVTGCCTDICIQQFAVTLKAACNQENRALEIIVPRQLVETYDSPDHDAVLMGTAALVSMLGNGITVVNYHA